MILCTRTQAMKIGSTFVTVTHCILSSLSCLKCLWISKSLSMCYLFLQVMVLLVIPVLNRSCWRCRFTCTSCHCSCRFSWLVSKVCCSFVLQHCGSTRGVHERSSSNGLFFLLIGLKILGWLGCSRLLWILSVDGSFRLVLSLSQFYTCHLLVSKHLRIALSRGCIRWLWHLFLSRANYVDTRGDRNHTSAILHLDLSETLLLIVTLLRF